MHLIQMKVGRTAVLHQQYHKHWDYICSTEDQILALLNIVSTKQKRKPLLLTSDLTNFIEQLQNVPVGHSTVLLHFIQSLSPLSKSNVTAMFPLGSISSPYLKACFFMLLHKLPPFQSRSYLSVQICRHQKSIFQ